MEKSMSSIIYPRENKKGTLIYRVRCKVCHSVWETKTPRSSLRDHWYDRHPDQFGSIEKLLEDPKDQWSE